VSPAKLVTLDQVRAAYVAHGSMRAAGRALGVSGARVQAILARNGGAPPTLARSEREILDAITRLTGIVTRGPSIDQLAAEMGLTTRALRYRVSRLRKANLVFQDADGGILPTDAARERIRAVLA
jgi:hypothetical protein